MTGLCCLGILTPGMPGRGIGCWPVMGVAGGSENGSLELPRLGTFILVLVRAAAPGMGPSVIEKMSNLEITQFFFLFLPNIHACKNISFSNISK